MVLRLSAGLARLPPAAKQLPGRVLSEVVAEGATVLTDFLLGPWRPRSLLPDVYHVCLWPSCLVGTYRSALYLYKVTPHMRRAPLSRLHTLPD